MTTTRIRLAETQSTNRWLKARLADFLPGQDVLVSADFQTAGSGCGTNRWESERGQNLLFSLLWHPRGLAAADQFLISMAVATAIRGVLARRFPDHAEAFAIKWPNDIYHADRKLCGMLSENALQGDLIRHSIIGIGLNVNQLSFLSDAPNPVSLRQISGEVLDREALLDELTEQILSRLSQTRTAENHPTISDNYHRHLYRRGELHRYIFPDGQPQECRLDGVDRYGRLHLSYKPAVDGIEGGGEERRATFGFKEVEFVI